MKMLESLAGVDSNLKYDSHKANWHVFEYNNGFKVCMELIPYAMSLRTINLEKNGQ